MRPPPPKKKTRWVILPCLVWRGNSMKLTKIIVVRATVVGFLILKKDLNLWGNPRKHERTFENNAVRAAEVAFWFWIYIQNWETILVKMMCELLKSSKNKGIWVDNNFWVTHCSVHYDLLIGRREVVLQRPLIGGPRSDWTYLTSSKSSLLCKCRHFC